MKFLNFMIKYNNLYYNINFILNSVCAFITKLKKLKFLFI